MVRNSWNDRIIDMIIYTLLAVLSFTAIYPFWNTLVMSLNEGKDTAMGGLTFWPREFTISNYEVIFNDERFFRAMGISIARTVSGTFLSVLITALMAFALAKKELKGKRFYMIAGIITMYFQGGLIPTYLWLREIGLFNNFWALIIPGILSIWNMIVFRTFFQGLPDELEESAKLDGCNYYGLFFRIVLPVSGPVFATLSLFTAVGLWNEWFNAGIFINNADLLPVQNYLMNMINSSSTAEMLSQMGNGVNVVTQTVTPKSLQMTAVMVVTLPIIMVYPFLQKYFVKGVMIGSLKE
ncbi:carbohydrate ABC transporter permease [Paenibacillus harenae]|uniref:Aldouronate transport system permease protein n=1 Tax=Paenibacillus harenae TaxID=306543 RepID=A0ABT9U1F2_PAEHA|nr:carbohydrate ABC transporter permease [Paenibacillus harenae]MDQ0112244.1 putative aldouronate transport system permease protein [Paenibacillus harenae]